MGSAPKDILSNTANNSIFSCMNPLKAVWIVLRVQVTYGFADAHHEMRGFFADKNRYVFFLCNDHRSTTLPTSVHFMLEISFTTYLHLFQNHAHSAQSIT